MINERAIIDSLYTTSHDDIPMNVTHSKTATKSVSFGFDIERAIIDSLYTTSHDDIPMNVTHSKTATKSVSFGFDIDPNVWMKRVMAQINDKETRLQMLKIAYSMVRDSNQFPVAA